MSNALVHYLARCEGGPIRTVRNEVPVGDKMVATCEGGEWAVACQPRRKYLSRLSATGKTVVEWFLATGQLDTVTCTKCQQSELFLRDAKPETAEV